MFRGKSEDGGGYRLRRPGSAYDRLREVRPSLFGDSIADRLVGLSGALVVLAFTMGELWISTGGASGGGSAATAPRLLALGAVAAGLLIASAAALIGVAVYRERNERPRERVALAVLTVEDLASYLGIVGGGGTVLATAAFYVAGVGTDPMTVQWAWATTGALALVAGVAAVAAFAASRQFERREEPSGGRPLRDV